MSEYEAAIYKAIIGVRIGGIPLSEDEAALLAQRAARVLPPPCKCRKEGASGRP